MLPFTSAVSPCEALLSSSKEPSSYLLLCRATMIYVVVFSDLQHAPDSIMVNADPMEDHNPSGIPGVNGIIVSQGHPVAPSLIESDTTEGAQVTLGAVSAL